MMILFGKFLEDKKLQDDLIKQANEESLRTSWDKIAKMYINLYKSIL